MTILQSILLGIVQGITEFLPVSSSGHLAILQNIFHVETDGSLLFDVMLHLGTLVAVFIVYRRDIGKMILETLRMLADIFRNLRTWIRNRIHKTALPYKRIVHNSYRKFVVLVLVSTFPTALIGLLSRDLIYAASETLLIPGICLLITAVLLLLADTAPEGKRMPRNVDYQDGLIVGLAQGVATLPGLSRSGTTIAACILCGMDRRFAVKYSFILSIPAILGAAVLEASEALQEPVVLQEIGVYLIGAVFAAAVGYVCIKTMLVVVRRKKFKIFSIYCLLAGALAIAGHFLI